jgi:integrase
MLKYACPDYIKRVPEFPGFTGNDKIIDPETEYLEPEAQQKIIEKIAPEDRQVFLFQMVTGCRASESAAFRKQNIKKDHIVFEVTLTGIKPGACQREEADAFPLTDALREVLS